VELHLRAGEKVCLRGTNGSGKTTLLRILGGGLAPTQGHVVMDGHPLGGLNLEHVRSLIGDSLSDEDVFTGTVLENIVVGRTGISENDIQEVCFATGLLDQVRDLPKGLLTPLDPQGARLPKSLVMRIVLARAIIGNPRMVLIEDAMRDWDVSERERLIGWVCHPDRPWTLLIVSNDPWVSSRCARTITLRNGRLESQDHA